MKLFFLLVFALLITCTISNFAAYYSHSFLGTTFSRFMNTVTPLATILYVCIMVRENRKHKKSSNERYKEPFGKN